MEGHLNYGGSLDAEQEASLKLTQEFKAVVNAMKEARINDLFSVAEVCEEFSARYDRATDNHEKASLMEDMFSAISVYAESIVAEYFLDPKFLSSETFQYIAKKYFSNPKKFSFESLDFDERPLMTATAPLAAIEAARVMIDTFMDKTNCKEAFAGICAPLKDQAERIHKEAMESGDATRIKATEKLLRTAERLQPNPPGP